MRPFTPEITKLPKRTALTVTTVGNPNKATDVFPALYGTAYGTKFKVFKPKGKKMEIGECFAFWPDAHLKPKSKWTGIWNVAVSDFVKPKDLLQKDPTIRVSMKTYPAATVAQILHIGPYSQEKPSIVQLHAFIKEQGYVIAGPHEESYLTRPGPKAKTIIRYVVRKKR
jgi:hypothetical protein